MMNFLLNNRNVVILFTIVATVLIALGIFGMNIDSSITAVLAENNPDFLYNQEVAATFTSSEEVIISILTKDSIYSIENLTLINDVTEFVLSLEQVEKEGVASIITIANQYNQDGQAYYGGDITQDIVRWVKKTIETNPMAKGRIINNDHTNTVITVPIPTKLGFQDKELNAFLTQLEDGLIKIFSNYPNSSYQLTGQPKVKADITKYIMSDIMVLLPVAIIVVMMIIFFLTKSFRGTLIPIIVTAFSVIWTFGLKGILGKLGIPGGSLTLTESVLPVVLISVACADGIHITNQSLYFIDRGVPGKAAVIDAMQLVRLPVILSALTTAVGFGSLIFSPGQSLKNMGIFLAFGVLIAMLFSLILIPVLISFFKTKSFSKRRASRDIENRFSFTSLMRPITNFIISKKWSFLIAAILIILISIPATINIKTDQDEVRFFIPTAPVRIATENIEKNLGGISTIYLVEQSPTNTPLIPREIYKKPEKEWNSKDLLTVKKSLDHLRAIELIEKRAVMEEAVSYTSSYTSYLQLVNYISKGILNLNNYILPDNALYFSRFILSKFEQQNMIDESLTQKFITQNGEMLNTHIRIQNSNTSEMKKVVDNLDKFICKLYQIDPKEIKRYYKTPFNQKYKPKRDAKNYILQQIFLNNIDYMKNQAKEHGFKTVSQWYDSKTSYSDLLKPIPLLSLTADEYISFLANAKPRPDFANDYELRMIADHFNVSSLINLTNNPIQYRWAGDYIRIVNGAIIIDSQIISLATATIIIWLLLALIFKSLLTGALLSVPVIIAIFLNFVVMWAFGVSLNPATSIVASVGMGVGIDYAIHYYSRFKKLYQMSSDFTPSLIDAAVQSSSGIIMNALSVGVGFLVLAFSKYTIIRHMGLIVAFSMVTSAIGALTILPALLAIFKPKISTKGFNI